MLVFFGQVLLALQEPLKVMVILRSLLLFCALLPLSGLAWGGGSVLKIPGTFLSDRARHVRQLAPFLPRSHLPPVAGDIWAAWLARSAPAAAPAPALPPPRPWQHPTALVPLPAPWLLLSRELTCHVAVILVLRG